MYLEWVTCIYIFVMCDDRNGVGILDKAKKVARDQEALLEPKDN